MRHYCTYFDSTFLVRGLTLYRSLIEHSEAFTLWVLCLDDATFEAVAKLDARGLEPVRLSDLESAFPELRQANPHATRIDYFFSFLPAFPLYILNREPSIKVISFLDADLFFFSDPATILNEMDGCSVLMLEHRLPTALQNFEKYGRYKIGFLSFRNDESGRRYLDDWWQQFATWCHDRNVDARSADKKYLDQWPGRFRDARIIQHLGANVAPWNVGSYQVQNISNSVTVNGVDLIFYHFHRLRILNSWLCDPGLQNFQKSPASHELRQWVYKPYLRALGNTWDWVAGQTDGVIPGYADVRPGRYTYWNLARDATRSFLHGQLLVSLRGFR